MKLDELTQFLNELFPSPGAADFAPNGLQVEGKKEIKRLATAVSANLDTIQAAIKEEADALIVHHGLFWQKDGYSILGSKREKISLLLANSLSLFAYHLPMDMHRELGNNWKAAKEMGWENLHPFGFLNSFPIGVRGTVKPLSREEFKARLESYYCHPAAAAWGGPEIIQRAALISGGAHKSLIEAAQEGMDAFITGSFDEPNWYQAREEGINFFAMGHSATERIGPRALAKYLENSLNIPCLFLDIMNPF